MGWLRHWPNLTAQATEQHWRLEHIDVFLERSNFTRPNQRKTPDQDQGHQERGGLPPNVRGGLGI